MTEDRKKNPKTIFDLADAPTPDAESPKGLTLGEALAQVDERSEQEYREYLVCIGAIRDDGIIDHSKIIYHTAQTIEELEALWRATTKNLTTS